MMPKLELTVARTREALAKALGLSAADAKEWQIQYELRKRVRGLSDRKRARLSPGDRELGVLRRQHHQPLKYAGFEERPCASRPHDQRRSGFDLAKDFVHV